MFPIYVMYSKMLNIRHLLIEIESVAAHELEDNSNHAVVLPRDIDTALTHET